MKRIFLSMLFMISMLFTTSCITMDEIAYRNEYVVGTQVYPVYYINSYPYYWFNNRWILVPRYRYTYIRTITIPRYVYAYRPNLRHYDYKPSYNYSRQNPNVRQPSVPRTPQPGNRNYNGLNSRNNNNSGSSRGDFGRSGRR